jgi:hypothetical protein
LDLIESFGLICLDRAILSTDRLMQKPVTRKWIDVKTTRREMTRAKRRSSGVFFAQSTNARQSRAAKKLKKGKCENATTRRKDQIEGSQNAPHPTTNEQTMAKFDLRQVQRRCRL